jgi:ABC-type multidrug transport system fused ATPase/permease subunit
VDFLIDELVQTSIRSLPRSVTVLTVAHRLSTVMDYDKILVLGGGKVLEYDSPAALRKNKDSYFAKLVTAMEG